MLDELKELWKFRELLFSMVQRDLRVRYKNSLLGFLWSMINPLLTVVVMTVVFKYIMRQPIHSYSAYVLSAYLPYLFIQFALMDSAQSVLNALPLIRKIYFPREILPLSMVISNFIHLLLALIVFFAYLFFIFLQHPQDSPFRWTVVFLPLVLVVAFCMVTGLSLLIAALNTFFEDVKYLVSIILYLMFFLCPIMYLSEQVAHIGSLSPDKAKLVNFLYHLNPIANIIEAFRKILLAPQDILIGPKSHQTVWKAIPFSWSQFGMTALFSIVIMFYGYHVFNKVKWKFVERP